MTAAGSAEIGGTGRAATSPTPSEAQGRRIPSPDQRPATRLEPAVACGRGLKVLKFLLGPLLFFQLLATDALAAEKLEVNLIPLGLRARNNSPVPIEARFKWNSTRILEGRLEMEFHEGNRLLGQYRSGDLALTGGEQSFRMLLPPALAPESDSQMEVQMKFETAANSVELEPTILSVPTVSERSLVVGLCDAGTAGGELSSDLVRSLFFERMAPPTDNVSQRVFMTSVTRLTPEDLPAQPLAYTSFDVVVLTAEGFKEAGERQLEALGRWVKGGGSVCVFVGGGLQPHHLGFLNQLAESTSGPTFLSDSAGNLLPTPKEMMYLHSGVGRSVIVTGKGAMETSADASAWRTAAAFLWKLRGSQARAVAQSGHWEPPVTATMDGTQVIRPGQFPPNRGLAALQPRGFGPQNGDLGPELMTRLMPTTVRLIPFAALIGMLALFVGMIGPADYFVLGWLRRRRLTWVLFPATSIAFTIATVLMANHYLGLHDQRRSLILVDLARDGTALRWNRFELVFAARDKQVVTELKDALWAPLQLDAMSGGLSYPSGAYNPGYGYQGEARRGAGPPLYDGTLPVHFRTSEALRQWQPELNRIFSFEPPPVPLLPNWADVEQAWPNLAKIRAALSGKKSFSGDVHVISGGSADSGYAGILPAPVLDELCASRDPLSLVSQISPTGGGTLGDAPAMDTEANDSVLTIVTPIGDDLVIYRRFFYGN